VDQSDPINQPPLPKPSAVQRWLPLLMVALLVSIVGGMVWDGLPDKIGGLSSLRRATGLVMGRLPLPTEPSMLSPIQRWLSPPLRYKLVSIQHIPSIRPGTGMPHPFVGDCKQCHLFVGGAPAGSQFKTPVGAILENLSRVRKVGPPILPTSRMPHPPAGRCIKCHDIVVKVPSEPTAGVRWRL
jgi:Magnetochrome domain